MGCCSVARVRGRHPVETWRGVDGESPAQALHVRFPTGDRLVAIYWRRLRHPLGYRGHIANPEFLAPRLGHAPTGRSKPVVVMTQRRTLERDATPVPDGRSRSYGGSPSSILSSLVPAKA